MGYCLFTARKLMLQNRLNQMNFRMMMLQQQRNELTDQAANIEMMNGFRSSANSIFSMQQQNQAYDELLNNPNLSQSDISSMTQKLQMDMQQMQLENQIKAQQDMNQLKAVQTIENQIDLEMKKLDTQVQETTAEMEQVTKAEEQAIKSSAPKYAGGNG